jgi:hypothetical protein
MKLEQVSTLGEPSNGQQPIGLMDFAHKLTQQMKGYKVSVSKKHNMLYVYRGGDNYVMGIIGYGDFQTSGDGNDRYAVWSPNIKNMKYSHGLQQNMSLALKQDKAVKNAMKYIRPLTVEQTMKLSLRQCHRAAQEVVSKIRDNTGELRRELVNNFFDTSTYSAPRPNPLQRELKHLVESGYEFLDKDLGDKLHKMFGGLNELEAARQVVDNTFTFVEAIVSPTGRQMFRVHTDVDASTHYSITRSVSELPDNTSLYDQHNLPDELAGKLSVLSMLELEGYVEGVGYRAADNVFYVRG